MVTLGYVSRPNGLLGAVVIHSDPSMTGVLAKGLEVELVPRQGAAFRTSIRSAAPVRGGVRVTFDHVHDRNRAEALVGATVHVERESLGPFREGEFLDSDLIDIDVVTREGTRLGRLVEVIATGANDVYAVRDAAGAEVLVPAVAHAVIDVDLATRRMTVAAEAIEYGAPAPEQPAARSRDDHRAKSQAGRNENPEPK